MSELIAVVVILLLVGIVGIISGINYYSSPVAKASYFVIKENKVNTINNYTVMKIQESGNQSIITGSYIGHLYGGLFDDDPKSPIFSIVVNETGLDKKLHLEDIVGIKQVSSFPVCGIHVVYPNGTSMNQSADLNYVGNFRLNYTNFEQYVCAEKDENFFNGTKVLVQ